MENATEFFTGVSDRVGSLPAPVEPTKSNAYFLAFGVLLAIYLVQGYVTSTNTFKAPFVGFRSAWEPRFIVGLRFASGALSQVTEGYQKVDSFTAAPLSNAMPFLTLFVVQEWTPREWHVQDCQERFRYPCHL
jgi:hypothetical protein